MSRRKPRRNGQGLVEYALILVLVAVVTIVILHFFGQSAQRIFGLTVGALGTKVEASDLEIGYAECTVNHDANTTTLWVRGYTKFNPAQLTGSTDKNVSGSIAQNDIEGLSDPKNPTHPRNSAGVGTFKYTATLGNKADTSLCPRVAVVQSDSNALAAWPVLLVEW